MPHVKGEHYRSNGNKRLEKIERAIQNGQSKDKGKTRHKTQNDDKRNKEKKKKKNHIVF